MRPILILAVMLLALPVYAQPTGIMELFDSTDVAPTPFVTPSAVAVDSDGNVYVAATGSHNVFKITPGDVITVVIDTDGDDLGKQLLSPIDIAVDSQGNVYVAGFGSNNAFRISPSGTKTEIINEDTNGPGTLLSPVAIAVDSSLNVYVAGQLSDNAFEIPPVGPVVEIIDSAGDGSSGLDGPRGIAVGPNGNVFVSSAESFGNPNNNRVFKITPDDVISVIIDQSGDGSEGSFLAFPTHIAVDSDGNAYVIGQVSDNVFRITPSTTITEIVRRDGPNSLSPTDITVDGLGSVYFTSGATTDDAFKVTSPGSCSLPTVCEVTLIDGTGDNMGNTLDGPGGIAVDDDGNFFVTGSLSNNVFVPEPGLGTLQLLSVLALVGLRRMHR